MKYICTKSIRTMESKYTKKYQILTTTSLEWCRILNFMCLFVFSKFLIISIYYFLIQNNILKTAKENKFCLFI